MLFLTPQATKVLDINCQNAEGLTPLMLVARDVQLFERLAVQLNKHYNPVEVAQELMKARAWVGCLTPFEWFIVFCSLSLLERMDWWVTFFCDWDGDSGGGKSGKMMTEDWLLQAHFIGWVFQSSWSICCHMFIWRKGKWEYSVLRWWGAMFEVPFFKRSVLNNIPLSLSPFPSHSLTVYVSLFVCLSVCLSYRFVCLSVFLSPSVKLWSGTSNVQCIGQFFPLSTESVPHECLNLSGICTPETMMGDPVCTTQLWPRQPWRRSWLKPSLGVAQSQVRDFRNQIHRLHC